MRISPNLEMLRRWRRPITGTLIPLLAIAWVGAAALPCAGMSGAQSMVHEIPTATATGASHHGGGMQQSTVPARHPVCPHCAHSDDGSDHGDAAAHAACTEAGAVLRADDGRTPTKRDLGPTYTLETVRLPSARIEAPASRVDRLGLPPPAPARHLRFCVFLN